ncbi:hypothetical protein EON80_25155 [bacterium]|nr:MAG: hypothetical protein EON80_25155 [bacterium]
MNQVGRVSSAALPEAVHPCWDGRLLCFLKYERKPFVLSTLANGLFSQKSVILLNVGNEKIPPEVREYMRKIGGAKTPAKMAAAQANMEKAQAARRRDPLTLVCTCGGGNSLEAKDHKTTCPRGRLLWQRARAAAKKEHNIK